MFYGVPRGPQKREARIAYATFATLLIRHWASCLQSAYFDWIVQFHTQQRPVTYSWRRYSAITDHHRGRRYHICFSNVYTTVKMQNKCTQYMWNETKWLVYNLREYSKNMI